MKKQLIRATATAVLATGLTAGFASFAAADVNTTGAGSQNSVKAYTGYTAHVENSNNLGVSSSNNQQSHTGTASADRNTTAGDTTSGTAGNSNDYTVTAGVDNTSSAMGAADAAPMTSDPASLGNIGTTGYDSENTISSTQNTDVTVNNQNNVEVTSNNNQNATSGNASSNENTTSGNVKSGDASNETTSNVQLSVAN